MSKYSNKNHCKSENNNHSNQMNPNNAAHSSANSNNHSNQMNPNNPAHKSSQKQIYNYKISTY